MPPLMLAPAPHRSVRSATLRAGGASCSAGLVPALCRLERGRDLLLNLGEGPGPISLPLAMVFCIRRILLLSTFSIAAELVRLQCFDVVLAGASPAPCSPQAHEHHEA